MKNRKHKFYFRMDFQRFAAKDTQKLYRGRGIYYNTIHNIPSSGKCKKLVKVKVKNYYLPIRKNNFLIREVVLSGDMLFKYRKTKIACVGILDWNKRQQCICSHILILKRNK